MSIQSFIHNSQSESESLSVMSDSLQPHGLYSPWNSPGQNTRMGSFPFPGDLPKPGIEPKSPAFREDSLPAEPPGKPIIASLEQLTWPSKGKWRSTLQYIHTTEYYYVIKRMHTIQLLMHTMTCMKPEMITLSERKKIKKAVQWHPTPVLLPGKSHGRRSLVGCSPWGH